MADSLRLLRDYITSDRETQVKVKGDVIIFGDEVACPRATETNYYPSNVASHGAGQEVSGHTLDALLFCYQTRRLGMGEYVQECRKAAIPSVAFADRRDLLNYLSGETSSSTRIDPEGLAAHQVKPTVWLHPITLQPISRAAASSSSSAAPMAAPSMSASSSLPSSAGAASLLPTYPSSTASSSSSSSTSTNSAAVSSRPSALLDDRYQKKPKLGSEVPSSTTAGAGDDLGKGLEGDATREILARERTLRDRRSILCAPTVDFKGVISLLEDVSQKNQTARSDAPVKSDFQINTAGSFLPAPVPPPPSGGPVRSSAPASAPLPPPSEPHPLFTSKGGKVDPSAKIPIIIVPAGATSLISILNAKKFLEGEGFMTSQECKEKGIKKEKLVVVERKRPGKPPVPYHVIDSIDPKLEWARVVAVFALGPMWQFKDWPKGWNFPADHFTYVKGFHLMYEDTPVDANVKNWSVTKLQINKTRRHLDGVAVVTFWEQLDKFIAKNKPYLNY